MGSLLLRELAAELTGGRDRQCKRPFLALTLCNDIIFAVTTVLSVVSLLGQKAGWRSGKGPGHYACSCALLQAMTAILAITQHYGLENVTVPMTEDGPKTVASC